MAALRAWLPRLALGAAGLVGLVLLALYVVLLQTVPSQTGNLRLAGLEHPVDVWRDKEGVPHIFAEDLTDAMTALGFAHAQDRLWQMMAARRLVQGRLAEVVGRAALDGDVLMRTLDLDGHARRALIALPPDVRLKLEAYTRGVNAWLQRDTGLIEPRLPPEMLLLGDHPEPWQPSDCIAIVKLLALTLSNNLGQEMRRLRFAALGFSSDEIADLMPVAEADGAPPLPDLRRLLPLEKLASARASTQTAMLDAIMGSGASNNWVVSGTRTESGKPLLANDPHLRLGVPSIWYFAHLSIRAAGKSDFDAVGSTVAGSPLIVLGRTRTLAWGFTNTGSDVQDVFIEKVNPEDSSQYLTPEGWKPFVETPDVIHVRGAPDHHFVRRTTRHGPVLPDTWREIGDMLRPGYVAALQWTALDDDDTTTAAGLLDGTVHTVAEFMQRQRYYVVPMQSMVAADSTGAIGLIAPGRVPIRDPSNVVGGRAPVPGWDATYDWKGFIPFDGLPRVVNPTAGAIGTANARIVGPNYPYFLTYDWESLWRQNRIEQLLASRPRFDVEDMRAMQLDVMSLADRRLKGLMIDLARPVATNEGAMLDRLASWDGSMRADAAEPLIFMAWVRETVRGLFEDDLGSSFPGYWDPQEDVLIGLFEGRARGRDWCDDRRTPEHERCGEIVGRALVKALASLTWQFGPDRGAWRWGDVHVADADNRVLNTIPGLGWLVNIRPSIPGGTYTLNRGTVDFSSARPFAATGGASMRAIYDFQNLDRSKFIHSTGQSGNPLSSHYADFTDRWARGDYIEIPTDRAKVMDGAKGVWRLEPR